MQKNGIYEANFWRSNTTEEYPIYPYCSEYSLRFQPYRMKRTHFPFMLICGIKEGALQFIFEKEKYLLQAKDVLLVPPRTFFSFESYSTNGFYGKQVLELNGTLLEDYLNALHLNRICFLKEVLWEEFSGIFARVHELNRNGNDSDIPEIAGIISRFLHICALKSRVSEEKKSDPSLAKACHWIDEHLHIPMNLKLLETKTNVSRSTLCRLFKNGKGMSPKAYWMRRRNERAEFLLLHSELSMKEISFQLGYSSQFHFTNEFSRFHTLSPLHFRKRGFMGKQ